MESPVYPHVHWPAVYLIGRKYPLLARSVHKRIISLSFHMKGMDLVDCRKHFSEPLSQTKRDELRREMKWSKVMGGCGWQ
jgi:hypothetical protein